jgi:hypothetical protein
VKELPNINNHCVITARTAQTGLQASRWPAQPAQCLVLHSGVRCCMESALWQLVTVEREGSLQLRTCAMPAADRLACVLYHLQQLLKKYAGAQLAKEACSRADDSERMCCLAKTRCCPLAAASRPACCLSLKATAAAAVALLLCHRQLWGKHAWCYSLAIAETTISASRRIQASLFSVLYSTH